MNKHASRRRTPEAPAEGPAPVPTQSPPEPFGPAPGAAAEPRPGAAGPGPNAFPPAPETGPVPHAPAQGAPVVAATASPAAAATAAPAPAVVAAAAASTRGVAPAHGAPLAQGEASPTAARTERASRGDAPARQAPEPERAESILQQLRLRLAVDGASRRALISLVPAELGRISIRLVLEDGRLSARVRAESRETLAVLERHVPELRAALAEHGFEAEGFDLGLAEDGPGRGAGRGTEEDPEERRPDGPLSAIGRRQGAHADEVPGALLSRLISPSIDGVDTYA